MLTQEKLKEWLEYEEETGNLKWKKKPSKSIRIGDVAGGLSHGYVRISVENRKYPAHHLVFLYFKGHLPKEIDHINGNKADNRIENLREVSRFDNMKNRKTQVNNQLGVKNVYLHKPSGLYHVRLNIDGVKVSFGYYKDLELAELVAIGAREKYHGEFARHA